MQEYSDDFDLSIVKAEPIDATESACLDHWADLEVQEEADPAEETTTTEVKQKENNEPTKNHSEWRYMWYKCRLCVYMSQTRDVLLHHMLRKHTLADMIFYICGFCNYRNMDEELLKQHLEEHLPTEKVVDYSWGMQYVEEKEYKMKRHRRNQRRLSKDQTEILESVFQRHHYINRGTKTELAAALLIDEGQVSAWFANRRHKMMRYQF